MSMLIGVFGNLIGGGGGAAANVMDTSTFYAPLTHSLILTRGTGDPTYTRASTAYVTDFEGLLKQVPSGAARFEGARVVRNLVDKSEDFSNAAWAKLNGGTGTAPTVTSGQVDPFGGTAAYRLQANRGAGTTSGDYSMLRESIIAADQNNLVGAVWIKSNTGSTQQVTLEVDSTSSSRVVAATTTWQRFATAAAALSGTFDIGTRDANSTASIDVLIYGAHVEKVTGQSNQNPSEYVSVGVLSAPYHGAGVDGVKYFATENGNTVASNTVTEATGAAIATATLLGYLAEGARTNRCLHSQDFSNAVWVSGGGGIAVATNTAVAPDGTTTADTLTASGANGTLIQDLGVVASTAKAGGLWLKRKTGTGNVDLTLNGGTGWTTQTINSSTWTRCQLTAMLADEDFGIRLVTSGDEVYAWQGQVESDSFLSSYIPTTTVAVARAADVLTYANTNYSDTAGTAYAEVVMNRVVQNAAGVIGNSVNLTGPILTTTVATGLQVYDGATQGFGPAGTVSANTLLKGASSWSGALMRMAVDGSVGTAVTYDGAFGLSNVSIGASNSGSSPIVGTIKQARIWTSALTDAQLISITTP